MLITCDPCSNLKVSFSSVGMAGGWELYDDEQIY